MFFESLSIFSIVLVLHIVFGSTAIISGLIVLCLSKGQQAHKRVGFTFVICMMLMGISGALQITRGA